MAGSAGGLALVAGPAGPAEVEGATWVVTGATVGPQGGATGGFLGVALHGWHG
jgi:hypothetical protein